MIPTYVTRIYIQNSYIRRIRNAAKKRYAELYTDWRFSNVYTGYLSDMYEYFPEAKTLDLGVMGRQAVELNINRIAESGASAD